MKSLFNFYENTMNQFLKTWGRVFFKYLLSSAGENNNNDKKKALITLFAELLSYMYFFFH